MLEKQHIMDARVIFVGNSSVFDEETVVRLCHPNDLTGGAV